MLSKKQARGKITAFGMFGEHSYEPRPKNWNEVASLLKVLGAEPNKLIEKCRNHTTSVPFFETQRINTWHVNTYQGGTFSLINRKTQEVKGKLQGSGYVALSAYLAKFETACASRDRAVEKNSFAEYESAIVSGLASIEGYINEAATHWNKLHPDDQLIDSKEIKVSLIKKLDNWVPKMTGDRKLMKACQSWSDFRKLKTIRDDIVVHPKVESYLFTNKQLCEIINAFRHGIAALLGELHLAFNEPLPSKVINAFYMPDVEIVENDLP